MPGGKVPETFFSATLGCSAPRDAVTELIHATATAGRKLICTNIYVGTGYFRFVAVALDPTRRK